MFGDGSGQDFFIFLRANESLARTGQQHFDFIGKQAFSHTAGELRFEKNTRDTYVYGDTNGDGKADFAVHIDVALTLTKGDFLF